MRILALDPAAESIGWLVFDVGERRVIAAGIDYPIVTTDRHELREWLRDVWSARASDDLHRWGVERAVLRVHHRRGDVLSRAMADAMKHCSIVFTCITLHDALHAIRLEGTHGGSLRQSLECVVQRRFHTATVARAAVLALAQGAIA